MSEASAGFGLMLGPVMGSFIYTYLEYMETFLVFAGILTINFVCVYFALPNKLNEKPKEESISNGDIPFKITYSMFLKNKNSLFALLSTSIICIL